MQLLPQRFVELRVSHWHMFCPFGMIAIPNKYPLFAELLNINIRRCPNAGIQSEPVGQRLEGWPRQGGVAVPLAFFANSVYAEIPRPTYTGGDCVCMYVYQTRGRWPRTPTLYITDDHNPKLFLTMFILQQFHMFMKITLRSC